MYGANNNIVGCCLFFFSCPSSSVDTFRPMQPFLVKVKVDRGEQYKIAYRWPLAELKLVDGKTLNQVGLIFLPWQRVELVMGERYGYKGDTGQDP